MLENSQNKILLYLRDNNPDIPFPHHWDLFGGYIEEGESPEQALIREVKEELDYDLTEFKFFKKYKCFKGDVHPNIKYIFVGKIKKPIKEFNLQVGEKLRFFSRKEIPRVKFANILKSIVMDYINDKNFQDKKGF